ncbi:unnamed protein product, partial [Amoebophrya sp. A120]|eukprot:GSA120T00019827001.1
MQRLAVSGPGVVALPAVCSLAGWRTVAQSCRQADAGDNRDREWMRSERFFQRATDIPEGWNSDEKTKSKGAPPFRASLGGPPP